MSRRVLLMATGDVMAFSGRTGQPGIASGKQLLARIPADALPAQVHVMVSDVLAEPSWDTSPSTMLALARRARTALTDEGFDGVVITHGTDTLEETAYLVDLLAGPAATRGGIVLTGAARALDDPATDGPRNLASAVVAAADPALRGVGAVVCVNDELHAARWATHIDATSVAGFSSAPHPVLGRVGDGRVERYAPAPPRPPRPEGDPESDVALVKTYPGIDPVLLAAIVDAGARGVVLEGTGPGNVPVSLFTTIGDLTEWDIPVVVASRCHTSNGSMEDLLTGAALPGKVGAISARGLAPAKARVALMVALGGGGVTAVRDWFSRL